MWNGTVRNLEIHLPITSFFVYISAPKKRIGHDQRSADLLSHLLFDGFLYNLTSMCWYNYHFQ